MQAPKVRINIVRSKFDIEREKYVIIDNAEQSVEQLTDDLHYLMGKTYIDHDSGL